MQTLAIGARGHEVTFLQRMLNKRGADPYVTEDGSFGPRTQTALIAFQRANTVTPANGVCGPSTWQRLGSILELMHNIVGYAQPDTMTCWSAAATMMFGTNRSIGPGAATMFDDHSLQPTLDNVEVFVRGLGWRIVNHQSAPSAHQVIQFVRQGPAWVVFQGTNFAHAVVFSGVLTDNAPDGTGTVFRVHDPWPPRARRTSVYGTTYLGQTVWLRSVRPAKAAMIAFVAQR